jgi:co-chaperonin GroES (HSP10)
MIRMLDDKVAIIPVKDPDHYGSIIIPDSVRDSKRSDQGVVYAIGPNVRDVTIGDHVLFSPYSGSKITIVDVGVLHVMPEGEIEAWFDDEDEEQIFPLSQVIDLVRQASDQQAVRGGARCTVNELRDRIIDEFQNVTFSRGLEY